MHPAKNGDVAIIQPTGKKAGHYGIVLTKLGNGLAKCYERVFIIADDMDLAAYGVISKNVISIPVLKKFALVDHHQNQFISPVTNLLHYFFNSLIVTYLGLIRCKKLGVQRIYITDAEFLMMSLAIWSARASKLKILIQVNAANFSLATYSRHGLLGKYYKVIQKASFKLLLRRSNIGITVLTDWHATQLANQLGLSDDKIITAPSGFDDTAEVIPKQKARETLGFDQKKTYLLIFGNLRKDKDYATALRAFESVKAENTCLLVVGNDSEISAPEFNEMVTEHCPSGEVIAHIEFLNYKKVCLYFSAADFLILPYKSNYRDGAGPLQKEAPTFNVPVIVSTSAGMDKTVSKYDIGLSYTAERVESLANAMLEALNLNEAQVNKLRHNYKNMIKEYCWNEMARRLAGFLSGKHSG